LLQGGIHDEDDDDEDGDEEDADVPCDLDDGALHTEAYAEEGRLVAARPLARGDHALDAALAETARHDDAPASQG